MCVYIVPLLIYLASNTVVTLKSMLQFTEGHWKWYHSKSWTLFPICIPWQLWPYL